MAYLNNSDVFRAEREKWRSVIVEDSALPKQVFRNPAGPFLFFEFGLFFTRRFFECMKKFLTSTNDAAASFVVVDPDPIEYFYREFQKYPVIRVSAEDSAEDYLNALSEDPGNSSADAVIYNSTKIVLYPPSLHWSIFGDRDFEWAVINCGSEETFRFFMESSISDHVHSAEELVLLLGDILSGEAGRANLNETAAALMNNFAKSVDRAQSD